MEFVFFDFGLFGIVVIQGFANVALFAAGLAVSG